MKKRFINYIAHALCLARLTVIKYTQALDKFDLFLQREWKSVDDPEEITIADIYDFISEMGEAWLSANYSNWIITWLKSYFNYLRDVLELNVIESRRIRYSKVPQRDIEYYDETEKNKILGMVNKWVGIKNVTKLRNKLLVYMFLHTWLRCHELAKIKVSDIGENLKVRGKWGKIRYVFLREELLDLIRHYLSIREKKSDYLFPTHNKWEGHIYECSIRGIFVKMSKELWFRIHPHGFRHTFANDLLRLPWSNIYNLAKLLWHSNISTTQVYLGCDNSELKRLQFWLKYA